MSDFDLSIGKNNKFSSEDIKAGIKQEDIKDEKLLSIFNIYDNGNKILEENEINRLKQDLKSAAAEDGNINELSNREAKKLIKRLGINGIKANDLINFINNLVESSAHIKSCTTDDENITTIRKENDSEIKDIYDLNGNLIRTELPAKYKDEKGTLIKNSNGTIIFKMTRNSGLLGGSIVEYHFENEKDFNNQRPTKIISNAGTPFQITEEFTYSKNGKLSSSIVKDADNNLVTEKFYDQKGIVSQEKGYCKGELKKIKEYKDGVISQETHFYNENETYGEDYNKTITQYSNGKKTSIDYIRPNGKMYMREEFDDKSNIARTITYNEDGSIKNIKNTKNLDGYFGHFKQGVGDCYLLASIESIKNAKNGQEYLSSLFTKNSDGGYTIKLPGAQKAFKELRKKYNVDRSITGEYTFSAGEVKSIISSSGRYSTGEPEVILLEAAFEKYREDVYSILRANPNIDIFDVQYEAGLDIITGRGLQPEGMLEGGHPADAIFILTGERSEVYDNPNDPIVSENRLKDYDTQTEMLSSVVIGGENGIKTSKDSLNKMLDKLMNDKDGSFVATASFKIGNIYDGHVVSIKKVTKDEVILVNPWDTSRTITMSRKEFVNKVDMVTLSKMPTFTPPDPEPAQDSPRQNTPEELTPINPQPNGNGGLTPANPKPDDDELTPVNPKPSSKGGLTPAQPKSDDNILTPSKPQSSDDSEQTKTEDEAAILDKADGNSLNRAKNSKLDYNSYQNNGGLTRIINGEEFKDFTPADFRKLINDYSNGTNSTKRTIEKIVHNKSNWEYAKKQDATILAGLTLIYNNYDKYKNIR